MEFYGFKGKDREALKKMYEDPVLFVKASFGVSPSEQQEQLLKEGSKPDCKVTVASGVGTGKTTGVAWLIHWFLLFHDDCKIVCTAPTAGQLYSALWAELSKWHQKYKIKTFKDAIVITSDRIYIKDSTNRFGEARTSAKDKPEALQGIHATNVMLIVDEASKVEEVVYTAGEGILSSVGARIILISNPTRNSGYFYDTHKKPIVSKNWTKLRFSGWDSPNVTKKFCQDMLEKYGENSNNYRVRVLGLFPELGDDCIIPRNLIEKAVGRDVYYDRSEKIAGLDPSRYGDDKTALVIRQGGKVIHIEQWEKKGLDETFGKIVDYHREGKFDRIIIDAIGIGAGLVDMLPHKNIPTIGLNVAERASEKDKYNRLRDELWFNAKEFFEDMSCAIDPKCNHIEELTDELSSVTYKYLPNGKLKVEGKDEMKSRGLDSPNLADALNLALYNYSTPSKARTYYQPNNYYRQEDTLDMVL